MKISLQLLLMLGILAGVVSYSCAQESTAELQLGYGLRLTGEFLYSGKAKTEGNVKFWLNWKLAATSGVGYQFQVEQNTFLTPMANFDFVLFQGGSGANDLDELQGTNKLFSRHVNPLAVLTFSAQIAHGYILDNPNWLELHGRPSYYFSNFSNPSLVNPFLSSFSLGTSLVFSKKRFQRVADFNFTIRNFQLHYHNDGGLPNFLRFVADMKDRYFTGGLILSWYNHEWNSVFQNTEVSYHKYTAYGNNAYEYSTDMSFAEVLFTEEDNKLNRSRFEFKFTNIADQYGAGIVFYDSYKWDVQHRIHFLRYFAHHISPYPPQWGVTGFGQIINNSKY